MGEPGRRVCKDVVQGGVAIHLDEFVVIDVRNPGLKNVDGDDGEKKRCLERSPSSGSAWRRTQG